MILCICPNPSVDKFVWLENLNQNQSNRSTKEQYFPGGKGIHVAMALKELGEDVCVLGFWGGPTGDWIKDQCYKLGIVCYGPSTNEWSRTCITFKSTHELNDTELLGTGPKISDAQFEDFLKIYLSILEKSTCVVMSGSWPDGASADGYAQLIKTASSKGKKVFLDCSGEQLRNSLLQKPYLIHINKKEGEYLYGYTGLMDIALHLAQNCDFAAVTGGAEGLYYVSEDRTLHATCKIEQIYSAVGSGDCLLAGLAFAFIKEMTMVEAASIAVACGAANCIRKDLGMLYKSDVEKLLQKNVTIKLNIQRQHP